MEERAIDRLIKFIDYLKERKETKSLKSFEETCGLSNGYLANSKKSNGSIGSDMLARIISKFPQLNLAWLCTGNGNMIVDQRDNNANYKEAYNGAMMQVDALRKIIDSMKE